MSWNAIDALDDARWAAQTFLLPFDAGRWARLAVVAFFVAGGGGPSFQTGGGGDVSPPSDPGPVGPGGPIDLPPRTVLYLVGGVLVALLLLGLAWAAVGAVMEFVLIEGLRTREMSVRDRFREFLGRGLRLFGFRVGVTLLAAAVVAVPFALVALAGAAVPVGFLLFFPLLLAALFLGVVVAAVLRLTTDFAVPTMLAEDRGVLSAWRRLLPVFRSEWKEVGLYLVVRFVAGIAAAVAVGLVTALAAVIVAIPFLLVGAVVFFGLGGSVPALGAVGWGLLAVVGLLLFLAVVAVGATVQVPVVTYFRYYALFFLGATDERLDLVSDLRGLGDARDGDGGDGPAPDSATP